MRIRTIDDCLCRRQRRWTLEDLRSACESSLREYEGIDSVSIRTIQRDLELMRGEKLGYFAPIIVKERKYYTYEDPNYSIRKMPLSPQDVEELSSAMDIIKHYQGFQSMVGAEDILARLQDKVESQRSSKQVVFIETNTQLKGLHFLNQLFNFIQGQQPIVIVYRSFKSSKEHIYHLSPYFLKEYNNRWFLFAYSTVLENIQIVALDRIVNIALDTDGHFVENTFCNPKDYLDAMVGVTRGLASKPIQVVLKVDANQAPYVLTKPLHHTQSVLEQFKDGSLTLSLELIHNLELEHMILGFGHHIEVLSPMILRKRVARHYKILAKKYAEFNE